MNSKFKVKVNAKYDLELTSDEVNNCDLIKTSNDNFHLLKKGKSVTAKVVDSNFSKKEYLIEINHNQYVVRIENQLDQLIDAMGFSMSSVKHINNIKAPMPGLILDVSIIAGQEVKEDDPLLILEAMKMENVITSPRNGVIKKVVAMKGEAVQKSQLLIEFE